MVSRSRPPTITRSTTTSNTSGDDTSGFKRNFKAVRKDAAKFVRRRIEKKTHSAGARISEVANLLRSSVRDVQSRDSPFADDVVESIAQRLGRRRSLSLFGSHANGKVLAWLADELRRQRTKCPTGPRIAATLESLDGFESGITLVFADARTHLGILAIFRTADLGPFTSSEITILTLGSDRLSALRLELPQHIAAEPGDFEMDAISAFSDQAFYVLDGAI
jgi:hypothetical protein